MQPTDLATARQGAAQSVEDVAKIQQDIPGLLSGLKQNLTSIFAKDNPMIQERRNLLQDFLSIGERTRADILPSNLPVVAGSPLNLSPTQQSAIEASRTAASLAPLASLNNLIVGQYGNIGDILSNTAQMYQSQVGAAQTRVQGAQGLYEQLFGEQQEQERTRQFNEELQLKKQELAIKQADGGTAAGRATNILNQVAQDARAGVTLSGIMRKYATEAEVTPEEILRIYNTNSKYGPAKESEEALQKRFGIKPTTTVEQRNRLTSLKPATSAISRIRKLNINQSGPQNRGAQISIGILGGLGVDQNLVSLNQSFELMKQNVVRALQGARMSDRDIQIAGNYMPSIIDTPDTVRTKLENLEAFINSLGGQTSEDGGRPPLSSFEE